MSSRLDQRTTSRKNDVGIEIGTHQSSDDAHQIMITSDSNMMHMKTDDPSFLSIAEKSRLLFGNDVNLDSISVQQYLDAENITPSATVSEKKRFFIVQQQKVTGKPTSLEKKTKGRSSLGSRRSSKGTPGKPSGYSTPLSRNDSISNIPLSQKGSAIGKKNQQKSTRLSESPAARNHGRLNTNPRAPMSEGRVIRKSNFSSMEEQGDLVKPPLFAPEKSVPPSSSEKARRRTSFSSTGTNEKPKPPLSTPVNKDPIHRRSKSTEYVRFDYTGMSPRSALVVTMDNPATRSAYLARQNSDIRKKTKRYGTPQLAGRLCVDRFPDAPQQFVRFWSKGAEFYSPSSNFGIKGKNTAGTSLHAQNNEGGKQTANENDNHSELKENEKDSESEQVNEHVEVSGYEYPSLHCLHPHIALHCLTTHSVFFVLSALTCIAPLIRRIPPRKMGPPNLVLAQQGSEAKKKTKRYGAPQFAGRLCVDRFPDAPQHFVRTWTGGGEFYTPRSGLLMAGKKAEKARQERDREMLLLHSNGRHESETDEDLKVVEVYGGTTEQKSYKANFMESEMTPRTEQIVMDNPATRAAYLARQSSDVKRKTKRYGAPQFAGRLCVDRFPDAPQHFVRTWTGGGEFYSPKSGLLIAGKKAVQGRDGALILVQEPDGHLSSSEYEQQSQMYETDQESQMYESDQESESKPTQAMRKPEIFFRDSFRDDSFVGNSFMNGSFGNDEDGNESFLTSESESLIAGGAFLPEPSLLGDEEKSDSFESEEKSDSFESEEKSLYHRTDEQSAAEILKQNKEELDSPNGSHEDSTPPAGGQPESSSSLETKPLQEKESVQENEQETKGSSEQDFELMSQDSFVLSPAKKEPVVKKGKGHHQSSGPVDDSSCGCIIS